MEHSHVISGQVFGSSRKIQFIGISPIDSHLNTAMHLPSPHPLRTQPASHQYTSHQTMSIESLLDSNGETPAPRQPVKRPLSQPCVPPSTKIRRLPPPTTTITCLHASVAQKSYGSEKRFLCPPPVVNINSSSHIGQHNKPQVSLAVVCENGDKPLEQHAMLDENLSGSFKYLHVTGTAKAKQFSSSSSSSSSSSPQPFATFLSSPISIISKPSKKTAKARNVSTCILANAPVSLFNRINSQTVRTKYMTSDNNRLCAKNSSWSPFTITILRQPTQPPSPSKSGRTTGPAHSNGTAIRSHQPSQNHAMPVTYGTEIILTDTQTGIISPPVIIRKVDRGRIAACAYGPLSQMQKIALQLASSPTPLYLSAADHDNHANTWLDFAPSRLTNSDPGSGSFDTQCEEVDDYLCWTIVGISKFQYTYSDGSQQTTTAGQPSPPLSPLVPLSPRNLTPFPILSAVKYDPRTHRLNITGRHLRQATTGRLLAIWLGTDGPLQLDVRSDSFELPNTSNLIVHLPPTQDLLVANHDLLTPDPDMGAGYRQLELPILLVRHDGVVYHSSKSLLCRLSDKGDPLPEVWTVIPSSTGPAI
ncbi:beta-trefoil DNA-binding domain-containing protein [Phycomyces blakesleeanus]